MKILTIPDLHGKRVWERIKPELYNKIIFLGDYVDGYDVSDTVVIDNLMRLMDFMNANKHKVVALLGNHDVNYMFLGKYQCSGFRQGSAHLIHQILNTNKELFSIAHLIKADDGNKYLFSHAGISKGWHVEVNRLFPRPKEEAIDIWLNNLFNSHNINQIMRVGYTRGGYFPHGGPLWADRDETEHSLIRGYHQVVGHSRTDRWEGGIIHCPLNKRTSITYTDCLDSTTPTFYELEIPMKSWNALSSSI